MLQVERRNKYTCDKDCVIMLLIKPKKKLVTQLTAAMKRCFAAPSILQNVMFWNDDGAVVVANATSWIVFL